MSNRDVAFFGWLVVDSGAGIGNEGGLTAVVDAVDSVVAGAEVASALTSGEAATGAPESDGQRDVAAFGGSFISTFPPGRGSLPSDESGFAGSGGGAVSGGASGIDASFGVMSIGSAWAKAWGLAGGALATDESKTTTFPEVPLLRGGAALRSAPTSPEEGGEDWEEPSDTGELSAIILGTWVNAKNGNLKTGWSADGEYFFRPSNRIDPLRENQPSKHGCPAVS